jgi:CDP-diacylglycerol--glycerol-3-phosphate 3-phosphatidyltransferase
MTTANKVTIFRILLVPFFVVELLYYCHDGEAVELLLATLAFGLATVTDGLDGYLARKYHQQTELGAILDPLADKFLLLSALVVLSLDNQPYLTRMPLWLTATIFSRDAILIIGIGVLHYFFGRVNVVPHILGKMAAVLQMFTVGWILLHGQPEVLWYLALATALCTGASGVLYIRQGIHLLGESPAGLPRPEPAPKPPEPK